jgi:hypothetical protein
MEKTLKNNYSFLMKKMGRENGFTSRGKIKMQTIYKNRGKHEKMFI